jgi:polysaccharide chain length determinant protein (PEP-CTERM system associated)
MNATAQALPIVDENPLGEKLASQLQAIRRRRWPMLLVSGGVLLVALLLALLLPPTYRSAGTILIEQQEIPEDFVRSAVSSFADQRVQMISQRVMTSTNLLEIIERHGLYGADRASAPREQLVERVRGDIDLDMISADVVDPRRGGVTKATIAFAVAFQNRSPEVAARVANDLISLYLRENLETRKQLAEGSSQFLASEAERMRQRTAELEQKIAAFKRDHLEHLPEFADINLQQHARMGEELREVETRLRSFEQQLVFLDAQLVQVSRWSEVVTDSGQRLLSPADRLKSLRAELAAAKARYAPRHPDIRRLEREIATLEQDEAAGISGDVGVPGRVGAGLPDNPAYIQLSAQREATLNDRATLLERRSELQRLLAGFERAQLEMPEIEREYRALMLESQAEQQKYAEIRQKQLTAQLSQNLESEQKGERFTLIDPPMQPQRPISPNRQLIVVGGLLLALASAAAVLFLLETLDTRIHGRRQLIELVGEAPLAIVPWHDGTTAEPSLRLGLRASWWFAGAAVAITALLASAHFLWRPLDVIWAVLMRRMGV